MDKYTWHFDGNAEMLGNDTHNTVEDCIADARRALAERDYMTDTPPKAVFVGECVAYTPRVDVDSVLENLEEQAAEFAGDVGGDWDAYDYKKREEMDELEETLSAAVIEWLKKYGYAPSFYAVQDIKEYPL